jgi:hypothetical protein
MGLWMAPNMNATLSVIARSNYGAVGAFVNLVRNVGSVSGQALTSAIITGTMVSRGVEVQLNQLADNPDPAVGAAFLDGWQAAFFVLAAFIAASFVAAVLTRPGKSPEEAQSPQPAGQPGPERGKPAAAGAD